jgi:beta-lactamase regulating signal transducer with metallopeptidase domain
MSAPEGLELIVTAALRGAFILAIALAISTIFRRRASQVHHLILVTALVGVLLVPVLTAVVPAWRVGVLPAITVHDETASFVPPAVSPRAAATGAGESPSIAEVSAPMIAATDATSTSVWTRIQRIHWSTWLILLWALGAGVVLTGLARGLVATRGIAACGVPVGGTWHSLVAQASERVGLSRPAQVKTGDIAIPMTWGFVRPIVMLPHEAHSWTSDRRLVVLLHEFTHVRRMDWMFQIIGRIACAAYWFNPLVWVAAGRLTIEREKACDSDVLALGERPSEYATHLLEVARSVTSQGAVPAAALSMARYNHLEERLMSILKKRRPVRRPEAWLFSAILAMMILGTAAIEPATHVSDPIEPRTEFSFSTARAIADTDYAYSMSGDDDNHRYSYSYRDHGSYSMEWMLDNDTKIYFEADGEVEFSDDGSSIESMEPGASTVTRSRSTTKRAIGWRRY